MLSERIPKTEHEVVLLLEVKELIANIEKEPFGETHLEVSELIGCTCLFRAYEIISNPYIH